MFAATQHIFTVQPVVLLSTALPTEPERGPHSRRTVGGGTESRERKEGGLFPSIPPTTRAVPPTLQANGGRRNGIQGKEGRGVISVHSSHDTSLPYRSKEAVIITTGRRRGGDKGHSRGAPMAPSAGAARGNNKSGGGPVPAAAQRTYVRVARHAFPGAPRGSLVGPCMRCRVCARQGTRAPPRPASACPRTRPLATRALASLAGHRMGLLKLALAGGAPTSMPLIGRRPLCVARECAGSTCQTHGLSLATGHCSALSLSLNKRPL
jgi:hypothetical protein